MISFLFSLHKAKTPDCIVSSKYIYINFDSFDNNYVLPFVVLDSNDGITVTSTMCSLSLSLRLLVVVASSW